MSDLLIVPEYFELNINHLPYFVMPKSITSMRGNDLRLMNSLKQYHQSVIDNAREAERIQPGRPLAIALDTVSCIGLRFRLTISSTAADNIFNI